MNICPFLLDNLNALQTHGHAIYDWLCAQSTTAEELNSRVFVNRWGRMDWRTDDGDGLMENIPPHGLYTSWVDLKNPEVEATFIVGSNLGYGINHVLTNTPNTHKVIVLEPNPNLLAACLGQSDYRPFLDIKKLHFCVPSTEYLDAVIRNLDLHFVHGAIHVRGDTPSTQLGPEYARWTKRIRDMMENFSVELTTLRYRQDTMVKNELSNFERTLQDGSLQRMEGRGRGLSAVILGAGPSLAEHAPLLRDKPGDALYATSMQTLPALQPFDLKPDFCLAIDYSPGMLGLYDRLDLDWVQDIPLIYSTKLDPRVLERYPGPTVPLWTLGGMATFVMQGRELVLDAGGNVSLTLLRFLRWCNVSRITLVGQDFAWKGSCSHSQGHHAAAVKRAFRPGMHTRLKNLEGEEIISSIQYLTAKREMEADIKAANFETINIYGGYAPIEGAENMDYDQARVHGAFDSEPGARRTFLEALAQARQPRPRPVFEPRFQTWRTSLRHVEKKLEKLFRKHSKNQEEIHEIFERLLVFIKQDQLYMPYLYNEVMDVAGLARAKHSYEPRDFPAFKKLSRRILRKVQEIDHVFSVQQAA
jgi:hypothetical protein